MSLKKRAKISPEFSMSSLTDIIFLLLIFFMLTSTVVKVDKYDLPESDSKTVAPVNITVGIKKDKTWEFNGQTVRSTQLKGKIKTALAAQANQKGATVTIAAEVGVPFKNVLKVMEIANELKMRAIIATKEVPK